MSDYKYYRPTPTQLEEMDARPKGGNISREILPDDDYGFNVIDAKPPHYSPKGNLVLGLTLEMDTPGRQWVWDRPWSDPNSNDPSRDRIGEFLRAVNQEPSDGQEPDWDKLIGAKGRCRLKSEVQTEGVNKGNPRNVVAYYHAPKLIGPSAKVQAAKGVFAAEEAERNPFDL